VDHKKGVDIAVDHLVDLGHTDILFVAIKEMRNFEAFKRRILDRGFEFDPDSFNRRLRNG
jgi:DNA-binding LacI/PurR family transcriptional regulator